jgi:hypothetical protein
MVLPALQASMGGRRATPGVQSMRGLSDHGTAADALEFAFHEIADGDEAWAFLKSWRFGELDEWPEYYAWLETRDE